MMEGVENSGGKGEGSGVTRRRGCMLERNNFFLEDSFKSWGNYGRAFIQTPFRLKDRVLARSKDHTELVDMKARSNHEMKKTLNWWDLIWFGIGTVIGSGIFVLTGLEAREETGPAVILSYVVSGFSALLSVFCYTEFAVEIPVAGLSIAINVFLLGTMDRDSYIRFGIWSGILFGYYVLFGMHASYDTAKKFESDQMSKNSSSIQTQEVDKLSNVEEGAESIKE